MGNFHARHGLGLMTAAWAKAGGWVNPYVTDGLVAMWDGEWNAGWGVHSATTRVWKDLVGNTDLACYISPSWTKDGAKTNRSGLCFRANVAHLKNTIGNGFTVSYCYSSLTQGTNYLSAIQSSDSSRFFWDVIIPANGLQYIVNRRSSWVSSNIQYKRNFSQGVVTISLYPNGDIHYYEDDFDLVVSNQPVLDIGIDDNSYLTIGNYKQNIGTGADCIFHSYLIYSGNNAWTIHSHNRDINKARFNLT